MDILAQDGEMPRLIRFGGVANLSGKSYYQLDLTNPDDVRQLRLALGLQEARTLPTFAELASDWLAEIEKRLVDPGTDRRAVRRLTAALGELDETTLLATKCRRAISAMENLGPASKNKVRSTGARIIDAARADGRWRAGNPFTAFKPLKTPRRSYDVLNLDEVRRVLPCVRPDRKDLFTVAVVMGDRKGELFSWRKEDVDLKQRVAWIRRSHGRNATKTGRPRHVPIPAAAVEPLRRAMHDSPSEFVFPSATGGRMRHDTKLTRVLRNAMGAAGVVTGFDGKCRRKGCGHVESMEFREGRGCPKCGFQLWLSPRVRRIRFYDLRHTAATLHREAGCDPLVIKLLLGHAAADPTDDIYTHLSLNYQRKELDKLKL